MPSVPAATRVSSRPASGTVTTPRWPSSSSWTATSTPRAWTPAPSKSARTTTRTSPSVTANQIKGGFGRPFSFEMSGDLVAMIARHERGVHVGLIAGQDAGGGVGRECGGDIEHDRAGHAQSCGDDHAAYERYEKQRDQGDKIRQHEPAGTTQRAALGQLERSADADRIVPD